jgi:hypothetical protein
LGGARLSRDQELMAIYQHLGRTGKKRAEFLGDSIDEMYGRINIYIKNVLTGQVWLARGEKVIQVGGGPTFTFKKKKRVRKPKVDPTVCQFHGLKLNPDGSCPFKVKALWTDSVSS